MGGSRPLVRALPAHRGPPEWRKQCRASGPAGTPRKWPPQKPRRPSPHPKPASSLLPAPLLYLRYPLHLAGFTAPRPPGLPAQQQGWCFTDKHLIPSLLYRKSWRRPPLPQDKVPTPCPPASVWVPLTPSCSSEHSAPRQHIHSLKGESPVFPRSLALWVAWKCIQTSHLNLVEELFPGPQKAKHRTTI